MELAENPLKSRHYNFNHMFNNIGGGELFVVLILMLILLFVPFSLGYFIGLSKGRKEHLKTIKL